MRKTCHACREEKAFSQFYKKGTFRKYPTSKAGYSSHCKDCILAEREEFYTKHPDRRRMSDRKQHLKRYGLTPEAYNDLFIRQGGKCGGCQRLQSDFNRNFAVDHDHVTGKVRGLLCVSCNLLLGYAEDKMSTLESLIKYLDSTNPVSTDNFDNSNIVTFNRKLLG